MLPRTTDQFPANVTVSKRALCPGLATGAFFTGTNPPMTNVTVSWLSFHNLRPRNSRTTFVMSNGRRAVPVRVFHFFLMIILGHFQVPLRRARRDAGENQITRIVHTLEIGNFLRRQVEVDLVIHHGLLLEADALDEECQRAIFSKQRGPGLVTQVDRDAHGAIGAEVHGLALAGGQRLVRLGLSEGLARARLRLGRRVIIVAIVELLFGIQRSL